MSNDPRDREPPRNLGYVWEKSGGRLPMGRYVNLVVEDAEMEADGAADMPLTGSRAVNKGRLALAWMLVKYPNAAPDAYPTIESMVDRLEGDLARASGVNPKFIS